MENFILLAYEFFTTVFPIFIVMGIIYQYNHKKHIKINLWDFFYLFVFAVYIFGVFHFTGVGTIFDIKQYGLEPNIVKYNFVPFFHTDIDFVEWGLNILLFIPFGFLISMIQNNFSKIKYVCISGFALSLLIEISQLFNRRVTDIHDLIFNTLGALCGFILFQLYTRFSKRTITIHLQHAIFIYILMMFFCRFFLFHELGMAARLFHF